MKRFNTEPLQQTGLSAVEVLICMAVLLILTSIGAPSLQGFIESRRAQALAQQLHADFHLARTLAVVRNTPHVVCASDGERCLGHLDWNHGWIVFADPQRQQQPQNSAAIVRHQHGHAQSIHIGTTSGRPRLRYNAAGYNAGTNLTVSICHGARLQQSVIVNMAGRVRSERPALHTDCPLATSR